MVSSRYTFDMFESILELLKNHGDRAALLSGVSALSVFSYKVYKLARKFYTFYSDREKAIDSDRANIEWLVKEFKPNGGSSMRDAINSLNDRSADILQRLDWLESYEMAKFNKSQEPSFLTDKGGDCISVNSAYSRLVERDKAECMHFSWIQCVHPGDRDSVVARWKEAISNHMEFDMEYRILTPSGVSTKVRCLATTIKDRAGSSIIGWMGVMHKNEGSYTFSVDSHSV